MGNYLIIKDANARIYNLKIPVNSDSGWTALYVASGIEPITYGKKLVVINTLVVSFRRIDKFSLHGESYDEHGLFSGYYEDKPEDPDYEIYLEGVTIIKCKSTDPDVDKVIEKFPNFEQVKFDVYKRKYRDNPSIKFLEDIDEDALKLLLEVGEEKDLWNSW